jgi:hypothetical protein
LASLTQNRLEGPDSRLIDEKERVFEVQKDGIYIHTVRDRLILVIIFEPASQLEHVRDCARKAGELLDGVVRSLESKVSRLH